MSAVFFASSHVATLETQLVPSAGVRRSRQRTWTLTQDGLANCLSREPVILRPDTAEDDGTFPRQGFIRSSDKLDIPMLALP
jgi:hypothetical protein